MVTIPTESSKSLMTTGWKPFRSMIDFGHALDDHVIFPAQRQAIYLFFSNDDELRQIDGISAFTQDLPLRTSLSTIMQE